jgi:predicted transcriptional regulator
MTAKPIDDRSKLSKEQLDLVQEFEAVYNKVDHFLRKSSSSDNTVPFTHLVNEHSRRHPAWRDADLLKTIAKVRNAIVHVKTAPYRYVAIPTPELMEDLSACHERLTKPVLAFTKFQRKVKSVSIQDNLAQVLKIIKNKDYSQFPVYGPDGFRGLLTENGITRWLAHHVTTQISLVELEEVLVEWVIEKEENQGNYQFVGRNMRVDDIVQQFASHELLEAVLVTATGKQSEGLLGIATRWDIIHIK